MVLEFLKFNSFRVQSFFSCGQAILGWLLFMAITRSHSIMVRASAPQSYVLMDPGSNPHQVSFFIYLNHDWINKILKNVAHLHMLYTNLEEQQVAPPTLSLFLDNVFLFLVQNLPIYLEIWLSNIECTRQVGNFNLDLSRPCLSACLIDKSLDRLWFTDIYYLCTTLVEDWCLQQRADA